MSGIILSTKWTDEPDSLDEVIDRIVRCNPVMFVIYVNEASNKMVVKCEDPWMGFSVSCIGFCSKPIDAVPIEKLIDTINEKLDLGNKYVVTYKEYSRMALCPVMKYIVVLRYE